MNRLKTDPSPFLSFELQNYLELADFTPKRGRFNDLNFLKGDLLLRFVNDTLIVRRYHEGDGDRAAGYDEEQRIYQISAMDEVRWVFLLHALDIVPIPETYRRASLQEKLSMHTAVDAVFETTKEYN